MILFLQKSIFAMESEQVKLIEYFSKYISKDWYLNAVLYDLAKRLATNTYASGQKAWEDAFTKEKEHLSLDEETFLLVLHAGNGFFGRSLEENVCFLKKMIEELESRKKEIKEKNTKERKVWIPISMLGGVMVMILFL